MVKEHLEQGKTITSYEAFKLYNITRLSAIIYDLRKLGYLIFSDIKKGNGCVYAEYKLLKKPN